MDVIVNYDGFRLDEDVTGPWAQMVAGLNQRFYRTVTRYVSVRPDRPAAG